MDIPKVSIVLRSIDVDWRYIIWQAGVTITDHVSDTRLSGAHFRKSFHILRINWGTWERPGAGFLNIATHVSGLPVQHVVSHILLARTNELFLFRWSSHRCGCLRSVIEDDPTVGHPQRKATLFDRDAIDDSGVHVHCHRVHILPEILRTGRGRRSHSEMP